LPRSDRYVCTVVNRRAETGDLFDGHGEIGVTKDNDSTLTRKYAPSDSAALSTHRQVNRVEARVVPGRLIRDSGSTVLTRVFHDEYLAFDVLCIDEALETADGVREALLLIQSRDDDRQVD